MTTPPARDDAVDCLAQFPVLRSRDVGVVVAGGFVAFRRWVAGIVTAVGDNALAVDGKTVRGSRDGQRSPIHLVSAFATERGLVPGQEKVADKSNEITAIPELLKALLIRGYLVTLDAMGCQTGIAATIRDKGADYLLAVKGTLPTTHRGDREQAAQAREVSGIFCQPRGVFDRHGSLRWSAPLGAATHADGPPSS